MIPAEQLQLTSGKALAIQIDIIGATATVANPYMTINEFGSPLNDEGKVLLASSIVATRSPSLFGSPKTNSEPTTDDNDKPDEGDRDEPTTDDPQPPAKPAESSGTSQPKAA